jgi:hypothetical protein
MQLGVELARSAHLGVVNPNGYTDMSLADLRRRRLFDLTLFWEKEGLSVIVDAAFHQRDKRVEFVKNLVISGSRNDHVFLCCISKDPHQRLARLQRRNEAIERRLADENEFSAKDALESEVMTWPEAERRLEEYQEPTDDEPYPVIFFDRDKPTIEIRNAHYASVRVNEFCIKVQNILTFGLERGKI